MSKEHRAWRERGDIGSNLLSFWLTGVASDKINETYYVNRVKAERKRVKSMVSAQKVRMLKGGGVTLSTILRETEEQGRLNVEAIRHERTVAKLRAISRRTQSQVKRAGLLTRPGHVMFRKGRL